MKRLTYALFITIMLFGYNAYGQVIPCEPDYDGTIQRYKTPNKFPQFYTDMPYDVMIAYIAMDSVAKNARGKEIKDFLYRQSFGDTLKYLRKFYYETIDYDPLLFWTYRLQGDTNDLTSSFFIIDELKEKMRSSGYSKTLKRDNIFFEADAISHIKVINVKTKYDSSAAFANSQVEITGKVLDKIKGQKLHTDIDFMYHKTNRLAAEENDYLRFMYCKEWETKVEKNGFIEDGSYHIADLYGDSLCKINKEYIVFYRVAIFEICEENKINYFHYFINPGYENNLLAFSIENGIVQDETDYFGFGKNLPVDTFKAKLRERIQQIKDMRY